MIWSHRFVRGLHFCFRILGFVGWAALLWGVATTAYHAFVRPRLEPTGVFTYVPVKISGLAVRASFSHPRAIAAPQPVALIRGEADLQFHNPTDPYFLFGNGVYILWTLAGLGIVHQLKLIFGSIARTKAFVRENVRRAQLIGVLLIAGHAMHALWQCLLSGYYARLISAPELQVVPLGFEPNWQGIATGVLVIALAELFRQGAALGEENALTI